MKKILWCGAVLAAGLLTACDDDKYSTLPVFERFEINSTAWHTGDSIVIKAKQYSTGDLLYKAEYTWSVACLDTTFSKSYKVVYDVDKADPYIGFRVPEDMNAGQAAVSFKAKYQYSAGAPQAVATGNVIKTIGASQLEGQASGQTSYTYTVE